MGKKKKIKKSRVWTLDGKRLQLDKDILWQIPFKCRKCVWRSHGYVAFCERAKCIWEK